MKITALNGKTYTLKLIERTRPSSSLHKKAIDVVSNILPGYKIYEEIIIPASRGLRFDLFVPRKLLAVEINGQQHTQFTPHFHGQKWFFNKSKQRDESKREFCYINGWTLVELPFNEIENWPNLLLEGIK